MPLPMVHFGISHNLVKKLKLSDVSLFYLGSISPDAVHVRDNFIRADKNTSHLYDADIEVWRKNAKNLILRNSAVSENEFYTGYGIHILTDIYWSETVFSMFKDRYNEDHTPIQDEQMAYYNDTDKLDFELHDKCEYRPQIWNYLLNRKPVSINGLVSLDEVDLWKEQILHWFDKGESKHKNPIKYITHDDLIAFIEETTVKISDFIFS